MSSKKIVIIAAGGSGSRLHSDIPKQYLLLNGKPVLMHTIEAFAGIADRIVVVIDERMKGLWLDLCRQHQFGIGHELVYGGSSRFQSVCNGIRHIQQSADGLLDHSVAIAIHDAARPLVDRKLILASFDMALSGICNVLAVRSTNSIRIGDRNSSKSVDRDMVWQVQTPQSFPAPLLVEAFEQKEIPAFTDDASVVEQMGHPIYLMESTARNMKLTFAEDFELAASYLRTAP